MTVLTSYDDNDLQQAGYRPCVADLVELRAQQAQAIGVDGLVCSGEEAAQAASIVVSGMNLVTPGIRPTGSDVGDQKRVMTPAQAIAAGADYSWLSAVRLWLLPIRKPLLKRSSLKSLRLADNSKKET